MTKLLSVKIILVAGKSSSIAASVIRRFLEEGATVLVPAQSMQELTHLTLALADIDKTGLVTQLIDYPHYYKAFELAELTLERLGKIDLAVFCFDEPGDKSSLAETDIINWEKMIDEQVTAYFVGARILLSAMKDHRGGMFISIDNYSDSQNSCSALGTLAFDMQKKMAEMFGITAKKCQVKWHHISLKHNAGVALADHTNAPNSAGDCIIALYSGRVSDTTNVFHSFSVHGKASP